jgi:hypothetical protein
MGIMDLFKRKEPKQPTSRREAISPQEAWRRAVVRTGNLDWQGLPIDRNAGGPIAGRPEQRGFMERVSDFLERSGLRIERRNEHIPTMIPNQIFDEEVGIAEQAYERRFDERNRDHDSMQQFLRDGGVDRGPKR